jgi:hypothetical protein
MQLPSYNAALLNHTSIKTFILPLEQPFKLHDPTRPTPLSLSQSIMAIMAKLTDQMTVI